VRLQRFIGIINYANNQRWDEVLEQTMKLQMNPAIMKAASGPQLALLILQGFGLIQMPIEDKFWSGAIFVKSGKRIPVLNTALPRANQYFAAWHEIYHLIFDKVSFDHFIERDNTMEERKAECLQERIRRSKATNPELNYHKDNEEFLINIMKEISMITRKGE
jgi:hypothetical protein